MPYVIAVANQKGGCGKTTISMNLAACLGRAGYKVLVIDADPQASAMQWRNNSEESALPFHIQAFPFPTIHKELPPQFEQAGYDVVVIDCPPGAATGTDRKADITRSALLASHAVLMPVRPTPLDYQASAIMLPLLQDVSFLRQNAPLQVFLVINGKPPAHTRLGTEAHEAAETIFTAEGMPVRVLASTICARQTFAEAPAVGEAVVDYAPASKASLEIQALAKEVLECLNR
ncbi:MAG TPA: ParA family partition ATPase [Bryobacteraceae bacterium]|nr:ParA family partition ATPase [Bryobacteraceae bacterium]